MDLSYLIFGIVYVAAFLIFATRRPRLAFFLIFALAPIQRALPGLPFRMTFADFNLTLCFAALCFNRIMDQRPIRWGPLAVPAVLYLVVCGISSIDDWQGNDTVVAFAQMIPYLCFAVIVFSSYGNSLEDLRPAMYGLLGVGVFFAVFVIAAGSPQIFGMNKNGLGSSLACITAVAAELWFAATDPRKKKLFLFCLAVTAIALLLTLSRGAWLGAICALALILAIRGEFKTLLRFAGILIPIVALCWAFLPEEGKKFAVGFDSGRENIKARLVFIDIAMATFKRNPALGAGVGLRKELDATNVVLMALAETGIIGLVAFLYIHVALLRMVWRAQASLSRTSWTFSCLAIGAALIVAKFVHGCVDHYWSRGALLLAWAGAGMATRAFYVSQVVPHKLALARQRLTARVADRSFPIEDRDFPPGSSPAAELPEI